MLFRHAHRGALVAFAFLPVLFACGKGGDAGVASAVAVKVNGDEITVQQVSHALTRLGRIPAEQAKAASRQLVEQLIDQQLLSQKALDKKMDRDPDVLIALEAARRQVLAQAYMEKEVIGAATRPKPEDISKFYASNPDLFAQRRVYRLQEFGLKIKPEQVPALTEQVARAETMAEVVAWLRGSDIAFNTNAATRAAEQLPPEALPKVSRMKDGEIAVLQVKGQTTIVQVVASQAAPLEAAEVGAQIEQMLVSQRRSELASAEIRQLREKAKLAYEGEFARSAAPAAAALPEARPTTAAANAGLVAPAGDAASGSGHKEIR